MGHLFTSGAFAGVNQFLVTALLATATAALAKATHYMHVKTSQIKNATLRDIADNAIDAAGTAAAAVVTQQVTRVVPINAAPAGTAPPSAETEPDGVTNAERTES